MKRQGARIEDYLTFETYYHNQDSMEQVKDRHIKQRNWQGAKNRTSQIKSTKFLQRYYKRSQWRKDGLSNKWCWGKT